MHVSVTVYRYSAGYTLTDTTHWQSVSLRLFLFAPRYEDAAPTAGAAPGDDDPSRTFSTTKTGIRFKDLKIGDGAEVTD